MSTDPSTRTRTPLSAATCAIALAGLAVLGSSCSQSEAATSRAPAADVPVASPQGGRSKVEDAVYTLEMKPTGTYKVGQEGVVEVTLVSKGEYHINDKYPIKFKVTEAAAEGVSYPKPLLKREDGVFEENKGVLKVPFVASKKGKTKVAGVLSFSVCSAANCLMQKQELEAVIDVQ